MSAVKNNGFDSTVMNWYIDQVSAEISVYDLIHPILSSQYTCIINMLGKSSVSVSDVYKFTHKVSLFSLQSKIIR